MKYINDSRKVYINDYNIPVAVKTTLTPKQKEKLDSVFGIGEILEPEQYNQFKDFVDYKSTRYLNLTQFMSDNPNVINIPSFDETLSIVRHKFNDPNYSFYFYDANELVKNSIPKRFENLGLNISYIFDYININFEYHCLEYLDKEDKIAGHYYPTANKIDFKFPIFLFDEKEKKKNEACNTNFLSSLYSQFIDDSLRHLTHELKHAYNRHNMVKLLRYKKISPYDYLKLCKYSEYSAEMEAVFNFINKKEMVKYIDFPVSPLRYGNLVNYAKTYEIYYDNLPEFINFVKREVEKRFLKTLNTIYTDDYYLKNTTTNITQFPNHFADKSDDKIYETLKKNSLSFEIFNPHTRQIELVDLSSYFKDKEITSKEKYILDKQFRKAKRIIKSLKKENKVSNKTLKILDEKLIR